jgi:2,4-didehydro-3-deoxy-L-rhamnonate hydrolase
MDKTQLYEHATKIMTTRKREGQPYFFNKPVSTITGPFDPIYVPASAKQPDWELELGVYLGKAARYVKAADALDCVAGYTIVNDITDRSLMWRKDELKAMGTDWVSGKSSPSYLPTGPYLVPSRYVPNPNDLRLTLKLNGEVKQNDLTSDMIHDIPRLIEYISSKVQLYPGDLICTGSPAGNGTHYNRYLQPNDVVESTITGLGSQRNPVQAETIQAN